LLFPFDTTVEISNLAGCTSLQTMEMKIQFLSVVQ